MNGQKPFKPLSGSVTRLAGMGLELAAAVAGGALLGYWVDYQFQIDPWGMLIGSLLGIVGGLYNLIRKAVHESLRISQSKSDQTKPGAQTDRDGDEATKP